MRPTTTCDGRMLGLVRLGVRTRHDPVAFSRLTTLAFRMHLRAKVAHPCECIPRTDTGRLVEVLLARRSIAGVVHLNSEKYCAQCRRG